jgi:N-acetylmuramoyl-L-alanine amidase
VIVLHKFVFVYFLFFLLLFSYETISVNANEEKNIIYIDPGHGGMDGGCSFEDLIEKNVNLKIGLALKEILEEKGYEVKMTRSGDVSLSKDKFSKKEDIYTRIDLINNSDADLFVSIHTNSFVQEKYFGAQVFYNGINPNNLLIASNVQSYLSTFTKTTRVHKNLDNIMILRNINKAGCLIETGFISNPNEYELYQSDDYLIKLANCIMYGIDDYFKVL